MLSIELLFHCKEQFMTCFKFYVHYHSATEMLHYNNGSSFFKYMKVQSMKASHKKLLVRIQSLENEVSAEVPFRQYSERLQRINKRLVVCYVLC